jgi:hypothetical protein
VAEPGPGCGSGLATRIPGYLWIGEKDLALPQLEALQNAPCGLTFGELNSLPTWDALRAEPRFPSAFAAIRADTDRMGQPGEAGRAGMGRSQSVTSVMGCDKAEVNDFK